MKIATFDDLCAPGLAESVIEVPGTGKSVRVRGMSRADVITMRELDGVEFERFLLARGVVEPALTDELAGQWMAAVGPDVFEPITALILKLTRAGAGAERSAYKSVPGQS